MKKIFFSICFTLLCFHTGYADKINDYEPEDYIRVDYLYGNCLVYQEGHPYEGMIRCFHNTKALSDLVCPEGAELALDLIWHSIVYLPEQCESTLHGFSCFLYAQGTRTEDCRQKN